MRHLTPLICPERGGTICPVAERRGARHSCPVAGQRKADTIIKKPMMAVSAWLALQHRTLRTGFQQLLLR